MAKFILFDTETTGGGEADRIIQLGAIVLEGKNKPLVFDELCSTTQPLSFEAMAVNNITPEMLEGKPLATQTEFYNYILKNNSEENYLIAHNIDFDLGMLKKEGFVNQYKIIDTLQCSRHLLQDEPNHRLQYLRYSLGLYKTEALEAKNLDIIIKAHDAIGDVLILKLLMSHLVAILKEQYPSQNPMNILIELTTKPVLYKTFKFGKYKDQSIEQTVQNDSSYIQWMLNNMKDMDENLRYTLNYYLNR